MRRRKGDEVNFWGMLAKGIILVLTIGWLVLRLIAYLQVLRSRDKEK